MKKSSVLSFFGRCPVDWKTPVLASVAALCLTGVPVPAAEAAGLGFYFSVAGGPAEERPTFESGQEVESDATSGSAGFGFVVDTNVLGNRGLFNYRLNVGYERMNTEVDDTRSTGFHEIDWDGVVLEQDFGFGGKIGESVRMWGGPSVRLSYHAGSDEFDNDFDVLGFGIGPVGGLNIGLTDSVALTFRMGFLINGYAGEWKRPSGSNHNDFSMSEARMFLNFGMLFGGLK